MPRPCKKRCISSLPSYKNFGPLDCKANDVLLMSIVEYEVIKLIDLEKLTQAQCAQRIGVSRTTVQSIYQKARETIAKALIEGKTINIEGGNYTLRKNRECKKGKRCCNENSSCK